MERLRAAVQDLKPLVTGNPRIAYDLAAAEALLGNREAALAGLRNLAGMRLYFDLGGGMDFASLRAAPERFSLDLQRQERLESNTSGLGEPAHWVIVDRVFWFLANTGWEQYGRERKKKEGSGQVESSVRKIVWGKEIDGGR